MRVISGKFRGKNIFAPKNLPVRPTTDNAKEALFNIINNWYNLDQVRVLDLCSGTGGMSLEFISRGATEVISVDAHYNCVKFQKSLQRELKIDNWISYKNDLFKALKVVSGKFDIVFIDPPYDANFFNEIPQKVFEADILDEDSILIIEHSKDTSYNSEKLLETRSYGSVNFSIFKNL